mgnify:FL=1
MIKITQVPDTLVASITGSSKKAVTRGYLKQMAEYLTKTLPPQSKVYTIRTTKTIISEDGKTGGEIAFEQNLVDPMVMSTFFGNTEEEFKKRESVTLLLNVPYPVNFFRRLKRSHKSNSLFDYIEGLRRDLVLIPKNEEEEKQLEDINKYFTYVRTCLSAGVVPLLTTKEGNNEEINE